MFEEFMGVPAHPLLVHVPVVFIPLLGLLAVAYALVPLVRPHTRWLLGLLALVTPFAALFTKLAGEALFARMDAEGRITEGFYPVIEHHENLGNLTFYSSIAAGVLTLALVYLVAPGTSLVRGDGATAVAKVLPPVVAVLAVAAAGVSLYYVIRTGDSGARAVWSEYVR